ncbi:hypothetical protein, partial [Psychrobacter sp. TB20-MNA-CIBAN-0197]|uniref:hypothetical protein n=1 Tax=Psychrobacter sp. TB20-MNA-CIBAN-0197 TaxID=3140453 RepID=UPI00331C1C29
MTGDVFLNICVYEAQLRQGGRTDASRIGLLSLFLRMQTAAFGHKQTLSSACFGQMRMHST